MIVLKVRDSSNDIVYTNDGNPMMISDEILSEGEYVYIYKVPQMKMVKPLKLGTKVMIYRNLKIGISTTHIDSSFNDYMFKEMIIDGKTKNLWINGSNWEYSLQSEDGEDGIAWIPDLQLAILEE